MEWKSIPGYDGRYLVSNTGLVKSLVRVPRIMVGGMDSDGYHIVTLSIGGRQRTHKVHVLVLTAFVGPKPFDGAMTRHLDGNKTNNRLGNLCWGTASENTQDALRHGTQVNASKTHCPQNHPYDDENTYHYRSTRQCKICRSERAQRPTEAPS